MSISGIPTRMATPVDERRRGRAPETDALVGVQEIIARATLIEAEGGRGVALVEIELCLEDGRRVHGRAEDRIRLVVDLSSGSSDRAAVNSAVRAHIRDAIADGSAAHWPIFRSLGRFGSAWHPEQDETTVSVGL